MRVRALFVLGAAVAYALVFAPIYRETGAIVAAFTMLPVAVAGWFVGMWGGLLAGLLFIPINVFLFALVGASGWDMTIRYWPGTLSFLLAGALIGWMRDLVNRVREQSGELVREREALAREIAERRVIEEELQRVGYELELRVEERTSQLLAANRELMGEIAERRQMEEALRESEERHRRLMESANDAIFVTDAETGIILDTNKKACELIGLSFEEIIGMHYTKLHPEREAEHYRKRFCEVVQKGKDFTMEEVLVRHRDGSTIPVEVSTSVISLGEHKIVHGIFHDVTGHKRAEEALWASHDKLRELAAHLESVREGERMNIAREVHDELGQSLTALRFDLAWLANRIPKAFPEFTEKIRSMGRTVNATIKSVQRIAAELRPRILDDLGLSAAIEWQAKEFKNRTGIKCEVVIDADVASPGHACSTAVFRIFQEALTNILRHANATEVVVSLSCAGEMIVLEVSDNGRGIPDEALASSKSYGLMGMRERAVLCGGEAEIKGGPGRGTTVRVTVPLHARGEDQ